MMTTPTIEFPCPYHQMGAGQRALMDSHDPFVGFFGGFGSGKSTALMWKVIQLAFENAGLPGLLIAQTFGALYANIVEPLISIFERNKVPRKHQPRVHMGRYPKLVFPDGTIVHLRSAEHPRGYDGLTVAWLGGDEVRHWSKQAYDIAISRVRIRQAKRIQRVFSSTPSMNWVNDEFNSDRPRRLINAPTSENAHNLPPDYIDNLRASYSRRMQMAVLDGLFTILEGAVFEEFDPTPTSRWLLDFQPTLHYLVDRRNYLAVDPGYRRSAWLWIVQNDDLDWVVYDELIADNMNDSACVVEVNRRGWPIDEIWVDPAGKAKQSYEGASTLSALRHINTRNKAPIRMLSGANRDIAYGIDKLRVLLGDDERPVRLRFAKRLLEIERNNPRGVVKDLAASQYPELKDGKPISDLPLKDGVHDHFRDAIRYFAVGLWLTNAKLKRLDPILANKTQPGYSVAS